MHRFDRPTGRDETRRETIEQFGMRRRLALFAEVVRRRNDSFAEMVQPDAIHHHARGERIFRIGDPFGELHGGRCLSCRRELGAAEDGEETARNNFAGFGGITFDLNL